MNTIDRTHEPAWARTVRIAATATVAAIVVTAAIFDISFMTTNERGFEVATMPSAVLCIDHAKLRGVCRTVGVQ